METLIFIYFVILAMAVVVCTVYYERKQTIRLLQEREPAAPQQISINSGQYVMHIDFPYGRDEYFSWDVIEKVYVNRPDNLLVVRMRNGEEHTYKDARKFETEKVSEVGDYMFWEKPTCEE